MIEWYQNLSDVESIVAIFLVMLVLGALLGIGGR